jgi:drug/metabolite transporter, DME family
VTATRLRRWDRLAVLGAAVAFGTTGTAKALGPDDATALAVGALRILVGAAGLVLAAIAVSRRRWPPAAAESPRRARHAAAVIAGAIGVALYQPAFFAGTDRSGVAVGTLVALGSGPAFVGAWELAALHRRPSRRWALATGVAVVGGTVLVLSQRTGGARLDAVGLLCSLLAGLGYAVFASAAKSLIAAGTDSGVAMAWMFSGGALLLAPWLAGQPLGWLASWSGVAMVLELGLVATALAYVLYGYGLRTLPTSTAVTLTLAEPVTAALAAWVVLGERLTPAGWAGAAVVVAGLALLSRTGGQPPL